MAKKSKSGKKDVISLVIMAVGIVVILFSAYQLYKIMQDYHKANKLYGDLEDAYVTENREDEDDNTEEIPWYEYASVDLKSVKKVNSDVIGWIYFENEDISYPILYSGDNESYLRTALDGSSATAGSIFLEGLNSPDLEDCHTIIYGHNMKDLSMFGRLKYYKKSGYYPDHAYFQIFKDNVVYRYQIFAFADVAADSFVYAVPFSADNTFQEFINDIYKSSYEDTNVTATKDDKIITLSTCSADDKRFVVHAVRVDEHQYGQEGENES